MSTYTKLVCLGRLGVMERGECFCGECFCGECFCGECFCGERLCGERLCGERLCGERRTGLETGVVEGRFGRSRSGMCVFCTQARCPYLLPSSINQYIFSMGLIEDFNRFSLFFVNTLIFCASVFQRPFLESNTLFVKFLRLLAIFIKSSEENPKFFNCFSLSSISSV